MNMIFNNTERRVDYAPTHQKSGIYNTVHVFINHKKV